MLSGMDAKERSRMKWSVRDADAPLREKKEKMPMNESTMLKNSVGNCCTSGGCLESVCESNTRPNGAVFVVSKTETE